MSATTARSALLVDFGGVLTTSVHDAFRAFAREIGDDPELVLRLLAEDPESSRLLVANENGTIDDETFEQGFAQRLAAHGAPVAPRGCCAGCRRASGPTRRWSRRWPPCAPCRSRSRW